MIATQKPGDKLERHVAKRSKYRVKFPEYVTIESTRQAIEEAHSCLLAPGKYLIQRIEAT